MVEHLQSGDQTMAPEDSAWEIGCDFDLNPLENGSFIDSILYNFNVVDINFKSLDQS